MDTIITGSISGSNRHTSSLNSKMGIEIKPIIKISLEGFLISANSTGLDFLELLSAALKVPAISYIINHSPSILDPHCSIDVSYRILDTKYFFSAVAFREAGYVGLYGFRQIHLTGSFKNRVA